MRTKRYFSIFLGIFLAWSGRSEDPDRSDENNPHRDPSRCEVCKFVAQELQETMRETGKKREVLQIGHQFDKKKKEITYHKSELRLIEALEEVCEGILKLNIHAERSSSRRFSKGESETMQTLRGLQAKGVKVDLGIPEDMWDKPSAPVTRMKQNCEQLIEEEEDAISNWFFKTDQETSLTDYLCIQRVLKKDEQECLGEVWTGREKIDQVSNNPTEPEEPSPSTEQAQAQNTQDPKTQDPKTQDPKTQDPKTQDPKTQDPKTQDPKTQDPKTQVKVKPAPKKTRSRKKVKAGKRGKGKKSRSGKTNSATKTSNHKKKDEL